jgi:PPK2 family polyphosphate:nucleotide phosphotransferase
MDEPLLIAHPQGVRPTLTDDLAAPPDQVPAKKELDQRFDELCNRMSELQAALGAEQKRGLLVVLQGRDACGKDGTTKRVFGALNPGLVSVTNFKKPSDLELRHDYLWRVHAAVPTRGTIGVFNRSHYEDVLIVRVHGLVPESVWRKRYQQINAFEAMLADEGIAILKFFLHVSKDEQRKRLLERLDDPAKNWKFQAFDLKERDRWDAYTAAYEEMLDRTSTIHCPWFIVPADRNKARDFLVAQVVERALTVMDPHYPPADPTVLALRSGLR